MKTVAVVPMKLNNERLPQKNTKRFDHGEPLCSYVLKTLAQVKNIDEIYVYCSNQSIVNYLPECIQYLKRSESLDRSTTSITEILKAFIKEVDADIYVLSHATSPFVSVESFEKAVDNVKNGDYDSAFAITKLQEFLWIDNKPNYDLENIPRTQDLPVIYSETSGFYVFEKKIIQKHNRRVGFKPYLHEVSRIESIDIDDQEDFDMANALYNMQLAKEVQSE